MKQICQSFYLSFFLDMYVLRHLHIWYL